MDTWDAGELYEQYMGRWSRRIARSFLGWFEVAPAARWLDVGCGTGVLAASIVERDATARVTGIDSAPAFVDTARHALPDARFDLGDATDLPYADAEFGASVSGLALNFVPTPSAAVDEMVRVTAAGGTVAAYVWDYGGGMEMLRVFWDAAVELDPPASALDEARRFPLCEEGALAAELQAAGLDDVEALALTATTAFRDFDDLWTPFLGGQGPAPSYVAGLEPGHRADLAAMMRDRLVADDLGGITLTATAWAAKGAVPA